MKILFLIISVVIFLQSVQATTAVRLFDGMNAHCSEKADLNSLAVKISVAQGQVNSGQANLEIVFLRCLEKNNKFIFEQKSLAQLSSDDLKISDPKLIMTKNEVDLLSMHDLDMNLAVQNIKVDFSAVSVSGTVDVFIRIIAENINGPEYDTFGPFRLKK